MDSKLFNSYGVDGSVDIINIEGRTFDTFDTKFIFWIFGYFKTFRHD